MGVIQIQNKQQFDELLKSHPHVLVDASAAWCAPCKAIGPVFEGLAKDNEDVSDKVAFVKFDTDEVPDLAQELGIRSVPSFFLFQRGELADKFSGANPPNLKKLCATAIESAQEG